MCTLYTLPGWGWICGYTSAPAYMYMAGSWACTLIYILTALYFVIEYCVLYLSGLIVLVKAIINLSFTNLIYIENYHNLLYLYAPVLDTTFEMVTIILFSGSYFTPHSWRLTSLNLFYCRTSRFWSCWVREDLPVSTEPVLKPQVKKWLSKWWVVVCVCVPGWGSCQDLAGSCQDLARSCQELY